MDKLTNWQLKLVAFSVAQEYIFTRRLEGVSLTEIIYKMLLKMRDDPQHFVDALQESQVEPRPAQGEQE